MATYINIISGGAFYSGTQSFQRLPIINGGSFGIRFSNNPFNSITNPDWILSNVGSILTKTSNNTAAWEKPPATGVAIYSQGTLAGVGVTSINFTDTGITTSVVGNSATVDVPASITQLTGDTTAGPGFGSVASTVVAAHNKPIADITGTSDVGKLLGAQDTTHYGLIQLTTDHPGGIINGGFFSPTGNPNLLSVLTTDNSRGRRAATHPGFRSPTGPVPFYSADTGSVRDMCMIRTSGGGNLPAGTYLAVVNNAVPAVTILNYSTGAVVTNISVGISGWDRIEFVGGTGFGSHEAIYIGGSAGGNLAKIDLVTATVTPIVSGLTAGMSRLYFDGTSLYFTDGAGHLYQIQNPWSAVSLSPYIATLDVNCLQMVGTNAGSWLFIPQPTTQRVAKINLATNAITYYSDFGPYSPSTLTPTGCTYDGRYLYVSANLMSTNQKYLFQMDPVTGSNIAVLTAGNASLVASTSECMWDGQFVWMIDSSISTISSTSIYQCDPEGAHGGGFGGIQASYNGAITPFRITPRLTPDGAWLYVASSESPSSIRVIKNTPWIA